ncbi:MAG: NDP-sugar synthase [Thiohalocapsa sp.]|uniref:NDP-sugar synthase n=1 Tax=Thiohalocapsa sp. TaxID=2497641 RepID=UPI0025DD0292|nr:NDP-sugar synthase [Thiohalocapsa sp.]MCG6942389.1 NDP-sugar synthase [Thiohalocapsa sp.]
MRALVFVDRPGAGLAPLDQQYAVGLLPLADKPLVQFRLEELIDAGITECTFVLAEHADQLEALLGSGERWGARFRFALSRGGSRGDGRDDEAPSRIWLRIALSDDEPLLALRADLLVGPSIRSFLDQAQGLPGSVVVGSAADPRASMLLLRSGHPDAGPLLDLLRWSAPDTDATDAQAAHNVDLGDRPLNLLESLPDYHRANRDLVAGRLPGLAASGREVALGLTAGRRAAVAARSLKQGQAYVGENSRVSADAELLGEVVIARDVVVDRGATIADSVILPHSYIGELVEVTNAIVAHDVLIRVDTGVVLKVADAFLLGRLGGSGAAPAGPGLADRAGALLLLLLSLPLWPLALAAAALETGGRKLLRREMLIGNRAPALPGGAGNSADRERAFFTWRFATRIPVLATLPRLLAVASGDLRLVGVAPLTLPQAEGRTEDWQRVRDRAPVGLIGPTQLRLPADAPFDERLMSDAFYAGQRSLLGDLRWLWVGFLGLFGRRAWQRA